MKNIQIFILYFRTYYVRARFYNRTFREVTEFQSLLLFVVYETYLYRAHTHSIFDISEYHSGATYNNLSAALAAIPENK